MAEHERGRLADPTSSPLEGELVEVLVNREGVTVEHILSGRLAAPVDYDQDRDEWVVVLEGSARLEVAGEALHLTAGDWVLLPRRTPHRLLETQSGTRWLAVHLPAQPADATGPGRRSLRK